MQKPYIKIKFRYKIYKQKYPDQTKYETRSTSNKIQKMINQNKIQTWNIINDQKPKIFETFFIHNDQSQNHNKQGNNYNSKYIKLELKDDNPPEKYIHICFKTN